MSNYDLIKSLGQRIREARQASGLSQEELAFKAGVHRTYLGLIERGNSNITLVNYAKIVDALGISMHQLFVVPESQSQAPHSQPQ